MQKLLFQRFKIFIFFLIFTTLLSSNILANDSIVIIGNKNISTKTILSFAPKSTNIINDELINNYQKQLFSTGFFEKVSILKKNNKLFVTVTENPLVNFFYIEGLKSDKLSDQLLKIIKIKENNILQSFLIKEDIKNISNLLNNLGYLQNKVSYQLISIENNKVNLFYKIDLNNKFKINRIYFIGNKHYKSSILTDVIHSSEYGWWKFLSNSTTPSESLINYDISKLKNFYLDNGFYDVQINSYSIKILDNKYANVVYSINSGNKYIIDNIDIVDQLSILNLENFNFIKSSSNILLKNNYSKSNINKYLNQIRDYLVKSNYDLNFNYNLSKLESGKLKLSFFILDNKKKKIIEKITITGNNITDDFVIRNRLNFSEGDIFNINKLEQSVNKIKDTGLFKTVNYDLNDINESNVQTIIKVEEQPTGEISAGAGAGTSGATIQAGINEKNFLGRGINVNSNISVGTQKILGSIGIANPDFRESGNTLYSSFFIQNNNYDNSAYENKIIGASISTSYQIYDKIFFSPGTSVDYDSVTANAGASDSIKRREGDFFTSKIFYDISKNTKNRELQTTEGYSLGFGQGFSIISDITYVNNKIFGSYYHEYIDNFVGSIKYKSETINGIDKDIKYSDRLYVPNSYLRGFAQRGIGPKIGNDFIGGNYSFYTSLSSTIPNGLPEKWNAITNIFLDTANVWGVDDNSTDESNKLRSSIGVGFSWVSPVGPISFTYAEPITKKNTDDLEQFNFKIGSAF